MPFVIVLHCGQRAALERRLMKSAQTLGGATNEVIKIFRLGGEDFRQIFRIHQLEDNAELVAVLDDIIADSGRYAVEKSFLGMLFFIFDEFAGYADVVKFQNQIVAQTVDCAGVASADNFRAFPQRTRHRNNFRQARHIKHAVNFGLGIANCQSAKIFCQFQNNSHTRARNKLQVTNIQHEIFHVDIFQRIVDIFFDSGGVEV